MSGLNGQQPGGGGAVKTIAGRPQDNGSHVPWGQQSLSHNGPPGDSSWANCCHRHGLAEFSNRFQAVFSYEAANRQGGQAVT